MRTEGYSAAKRLFDVTAASAGLLLTLPMMAVAGAAVYACDEGPTLFRQQRVGRMGRTFYMLKLRTMRVGAGGPGITTESDSRVTRVGRTLRRYKLDELPQLVNVLKGDMSLVGPRPELPHYVDYYTAEQMEALRARPGITDPASLFFWDEGRQLSAAGGNPEDTYLDSILPGKLELSLFYQRHATLGSALWIILHTLWRALPR